MSLRRLVAGGWWLRGRWSSFAAAVLTIATVIAEPVMAQGRGGASGNAREGALIDLTGQWVSVITEDWRWRMVTPPKGDTSSVPLNPAGRKVADAWDLNADRAGGRPVQGVRAARIDSPARSTAHPMGERLHAASGVRRRNADAPPPLRSAESSRRANRCKGIPRRAGSGSRRIAASSAAAAPRAAARSKS